MTRRTGLSAADVTSEAEFQASVLELAHFYGWHVQVHGNERYSNPGWPDVTLCRGDRLMFWELKVEDPKKGKATPAQTAWLNDLAKVSRTNPGIHAALFRPSDMPRIRELLDATQLRMEAVG